MSEKLTFEQIINSVTLPNPAVKTEKTDRKTITPDEQRQELAKIALLISKGHAGYTLWDKETTDKFETAIAELYNNISEPLDLKNTQKDGFYNKVDAALQILPDEHLKVSPGQGNLIPREPNPTEVGKNSCDKEKPWEIKLSEDGKSTILAINDLGSTGPKDWIELRNQVRNTLFNENGTEKVDSLIIDVRSNPGGPSIPYELIGQMLYGNEVAPFEKMSYRDTPQNDYLRCANGEMSMEEYTQRQKEHKYTGEFVTVCDYSGHEQEFPPFANGGFKRPVTLLTNRETGSAGESLCQYLKGHPGLTIAGENTSGCYAENSGDCVRNQFDYGIKIATGHCFVKEGRSCERTGFAVDFETKGQDALKAVTENQSEINAAAQQRLDAYIPPQTANDRNNRLAFNDMMFIRELNKGNVKKEDLKNLYRMLYPGKEKKFDAMIASKPSKESLQTKIIKKAEKSSSGVYSAIKQIKNHER